MKLVTYPWIIDKRNVGAPAVVSGYRIQTGGHGSQREDRIARKSANQVNRRVGRGSNPTPSPPIVDVAFTLSVPVSLTQAARGASDGEE